MSPSQGQEQSACNTCRAREEGASCLSLSVWPWPAETPSAGWRPCHTVRPAGRASLGGLQVPCQQPPHWVSAGWAKPGGSPWPPQSARAPSWPAGRRPVCGAEEEFSMVAPKSHSPVRRTPRCLQLLLAASPSPRSRSPSPVSAGPRPPPDQHLRLHPEPVRRGAGRALLVSESSPQSPPPSLPAPPAGRLPAAGPCQGGTAELPPMPY